MYLFSRVRHVSGVSARRGVAAAAAEVAGVASAITGLEILTWTTGRRLVMSGSSPGRRRWTISANWRLRTEQLGESNDYGDWVDADDDLGPCGGVVCLAAPRTWARWRRDCPRSTAIGPSSNSTGTVPPFRQAPRSPGSSRSADPERQEVCAAMCHSPPGARTVGERPGSSVLRHDDRGDGDEGRSTRRRGSLKVGMERAAHR